MNKFGLSDTNRQRGRQTRSNSSQISQGQACKIERKTKTDPETKARFKHRTLHVPNLMQMRKIYCFRSFALDSAHVKFDV